MKKYLLKLIDSDIKAIEGFLHSWEHMEEKFKQDEYFIKRKKAMTNNLVKAKKYREKINTI